MNGNRFDTLTQGFAHASSRRLVLSRVAAGLLAIAGMRLLDAASAKQRQRRRKRKKKPLSFNEFGCINVGGKCRGKDELCCSGICQGKKPKQGKRDKRTCAAHNSGICTPQTTLCVNELEAECGFGCLCALTTGNAGFCGNFFYLISNDIDPCRVCTKDTDCQAEFGPGAACIDLRVDFCAMLCPDTGGTACIPACV